MPITGKITGKFGPSVAVSGFHSTGERESPIAAFAGIGTKEENMSEKRNLRPGFGVDGLVFGMDVTTVHETAGQPDLEEAFDDEEVGHILVHHYFEKGIVCYFDAEDDFRLGCIEVDHLEMMIEGTEVSRISKDGLRDVLGAMDAGDIEADEDDHQDALVAEDWAASFYFEFNELISVQLGVLTDSTDMPLWPEEGA